MLGSKVYVLVVRYPFKVPSKVFSLSFLDSFLFHPPKSVRILFNTPFNTLFNTPFNTPFYTLFNTVFNTPFNTPV